MGGLDRDREGHRSRADVPPSKKEVCRRPAIRLISKKTGCCLPPKGFPLKRTRHKRCAMRFPQKVCKMYDVQLAPLKGGSAVDGLQSAYLKKFSLSTAYNRLPSKSKRCLRLTISFPQKVSAVYGLQLAFLKKEALSTACNSLPLKSKDCRRLAMGFRNGGEMSRPPSPRLAKGHLAGARTTVWQVARAAFGRWRTMRCAALFMTHAQTRSIHAEAEARVGWAPSRARS